MMLRFHRVGLLAVLSVVGLQALSRVQDVPTGKVEVSRNSGLEAVADGALRGGGEHYDARFDARGLTFEPALGMTAPTTQRLQLTPTFVGRGEVQVAALPSRAVPVPQLRTAVFAHAPGVRERFACGVEGVELSWVFAQRPAGAGDLVVRYAVGTTLPKGGVTSDGGVAFVDPRFGGVTIGAVTGIDANGVRAAGAIRLVDSVLELSLPHAFVEHASYPLVLDPVIAPKFALYTAYGDGVPDCAYERSADRYLVTFLRSFSASDVRIRGQIVEADGTLFQGVIWLSNSGAVATRPRVASFFRQAACGVVYSETVGTMSVAYFRSVSIHGGPGAASAPSSIGLSAAGTIVDLDIASEAGTNVGEHAYMAVWHDTDDGAIFARRIGYDATSGSVQLAPGFSVFQNSMFQTYSQPAIARGAPAGGAWMVVAKRVSGIGPIESVRGALLDATTNSVTNVTTIYSAGFGGTVASPDVDGYGEHWVVAWQGTAPGSSFDRVGARAVDRSGGAIALGPAISIGGSAFGQAEFPSVGYSAGKTWLGYRYSSFGARSLRAAGIDSDTCLTCADTLSEQITTFDARIVATTKTSGHAPSDSNGAVVWGEATDIWMQLVRNYGTPGTSVNLGGGCGGGGTQHGNPPATGMNVVSSRVTGLSSSALITLFNFSSSATTVPCGACEWLPFEFVIGLPVSAFGTATAQFSIPCRPDLIGVEYLTQWTTWDPSTAPCAVLPEFALSDRWLHTIGS